ncbi:hypothetical protein GCK72_008324 [Caenorhabditis remanei]|uniref:Uncharacterized protein n=1 Tax=Caenorhabditis remanei TaxID=31234 RepID=A0A6A5GX54_CAERE|nr:hypothetical protein GCK72_008324 [Caenorhabditis remanei]KAF1760078.1 hypothetical protein GCK72_008324 [Caenorhabditis remanei]
MLLTIFSLFLLLLAPVAAQYDTFTFNMSFLCGHPKQYTYDITFNIRDENPDRSIREGAIASESGEANIGITEISKTGFYEKELSRAPVWEPVVEVRHTCFDGQKGFKTILLTFPTCPALRNKTRYVYKYYLDITDKSGNRVADAEITSIGPGAAEKKKKKK